MIVKSFFVNSNMPIRGIRFVCCARALNGHAAVVAAADPAIALMKSRRCIAFPKTQDCVRLSLTTSNLEQEFAMGGMGFKAQFALQNS
jgi:hypothetical protein